MVLIQDKQRIPFSAKFQAAWGKESGNNLAVKSSIMQKPET